MGVEPSCEAYQSAINKGLKVFNGSFEEFYSIKKEKFACICLNNVLEHIRFPLDTIRKCKNILIDEGIIRIRVPNEFSLLQMKANDKVTKKNWWISYPDHINYFSFSSLEKLLEDLDFEIVHMSSDFPMELFILMGENYVDTTYIGKMYHEKRKKFEMSLSIEEREKLYSEFAKNGIGRNIIVYGKLKKK